MGSPWYSLLFRPAETAAAITRDDEAPVLVLVPFLAGIAIVYAWAATSHALLTPVTQIASALLLGPPAVLLTSWLGRHCLSVTGRLLGGGLTRGVTIGVMAWSWLPLLYLSLLAVPFSRLDNGAGVLLALQAVGMAWQLVIAAAVVRRSISCTWLRAVSLVLVTFLACLGIVLAIGFGLSLLTGDWFKMAGVL